MEKEIVITVDHGETRAAVLEEGRLAEIYIERPLNQRTVGNIYKGRVENVLPGMQAAFVNVGLEKNAFLFVDDAHPARNEDPEGEPSGEEERDERAEGGREDSRRPSIRDLVKEGQELIVQVAKEPTGTKGARVTRNLTIPGRFLVLMPTMDYVGVSRRISDEKERERLKAIAQKVKPRRIGLIVRTAAEGATEEELAQDVQALRRAWTRIRQKAKRSRAPCLLFKDLGLATRIIREQLGPEVARIRVDSAQEHERILELLDTYAPAMKERVELYQDPERNLFEAAGVEEEIARALNRRVWLKSGGYIVIDQTEALTAIDVNTGKFVGSTDLQDTVFRTNLEAAREIARQVRLRDIGGIIVIDFIDMESPEHQRRLVEALEQSLRADRTKSTVLGITQLGLVEMTRKKGRQNLRDLLTRNCLYCEGKGRTLSEESVSRQVRRQILGLLRHSTCEAILVEVHPSVASLLIGPGGANLKELERESGKHIFIRGSDACHIEHMAVKAMGTRAEVEKLALPVHAGQVLELEVAERHVSNEADGIARVEGYVIDIEKAGDRVGQRLQVEITRAFRTYAKARVIDSAVAVGGH